MKQTTSIKEGVNQPLSLALPLSGSIVGLHRSQFLSLIPVEAQPPPGYNATFDEKHHSAAESAEETTAAAAANEQAEGGSGPTRE